MCLMKRSPLKKKSKQKISVLKRKLWTLFSKYIRERDNYTCITCGQKNTGSGMHAGHYIPKSVGGNALYFNEQNVNAQCFRCNIHLGGFGSMYHQKMVEKYGQEAVDELWKLKQQIVKHDVEWYEEKIEEYT